MTAQLLQSLPTMSLAISIVVIICMAIAFASLFLLYGKTKSKSLDFGVEDKQLQKELSDKLKKRGGGTTYTQMLADGKKKERIVKIVTDAVLLALIAFTGALTIFSFVLRSKGEQVYFGDTAYLTVLTSSMQEKNDDNPYLKKNDDGVRIHQYALIGIDKVDPENLKEGDIIAFKYEGDTIYVHRIVSVRRIGGKRYFTTMGDANAVSSANETNISADRIVGVFNGYHRGYLGVLLIYMRSDIGMVALIFVFLLLAAINAAEWLISRSYEKRQKALAAELDGEAGAAPPSQTETASAEENPPEAKTEYDYSFTAELTLATDEVKAYYGKLKNKIMSYRKVKSVISWESEAFLLHNKKDEAVQLFVKDKALCVRLPFEAETYAATGLKTTASADGCFIPVTGSVTLKRAVKAIEFTMQKMGAVAGIDQSEDYSLPYRTEEELKNDDLIKEKTEQDDKAGESETPAGDGND